MRDFNAPSLTKHVVSYVCLNTYVIFSSPRVSYMGILVNPNKHDPMSVKSHSTLFLENIPNILWLYP